MRWSGPELRRVQGRLVAEFTSLVPPYLGYQGTRILAQMERPEPRSRPLTAVDRCVRLHTLMSPVRGQTSAGTLR